MDKKELQGLASCIHIGLLFNEKRRKNPKE
jgi:hypothetical protein